MHGRTGAHVRSKGVPYYAQMLVGMTGKVIHVDDAGGIHVAWSNGSTLAALHGIDRIRRID